MHEPITKVTARDIQQALMARHEKDLFLTEVRDGPSWSSKNYGIADAWAMTRSHTQWRTFGYEIKVSRSDFLQDNKWRAYLALCHQFYFVCPWGLIDPAELPADAGVLWMSSNGGRRLVTKKKAPNRGISLPEKFVRYLLVNRLTDSKEVQAKDLKNQRRLQMQAVADRLRDRKATGEDLGVILGTRRREIANTIWDLTSKLAVSHAATEVLEEFLASPDIRKFAVTSFRAATQTETLFVNTAGTGTLPVTKDQVEDIKHGLKRAMVEAVGKAALDNNLHNTEQQLQSLLRSVQQLKKSLENIK
jgi:hypothetical protein